MKLYYYVLFLIAAACGLAAAQSAHTTPVGYSTVACPSNSDTVCSVPLTRSIAFSGATAIPVDNADGTHSMTLSGDPGLDQSAAHTYYVKFKNGSHDGEIYEIKNKTLGATIVVDDRNSNLGNIANGTSIEVATFWTLQTLFPDGNTTINPSTGTFSTQRKTTVLIPTVVVGATNVAPQETFFYNNPTSNWRSTASGMPVSDDVILWPDSYFIIRHDSTSGPTNYMVAGSVDEGNFTMPLFTAVGTATDNFVAIPRPVDVRLDELGLGDSSGASSAFVASTGTFSTQRGDTLLVFDNTFSAKNKAPSLTYFYLATDKTWRSTASGLPVSNDVLLKSTEGFIIRKKARADGSTVFWTNQKNW